jgi:hypothetical protein
MIRVVAAAAVLLLVVAVSAQQGAPEGYCAPSRWPSQQRNVTKVRDVAALERAVREARQGDVVQIERGDYALRQPLSINIQGVTLRGATGDPADVVLHGRGMTGDNIGVAIAVAAPDVTIASMTIRDVGYHAIQVRGESGASRFTVRHARLLDTGQQLLKVSTAEDGRFAVGGTVACSEFAYTNTAPSNYTNGIDILAGKQWTVRNNRLLRIRGPQSDRWRAGPAVLVWKGSEGTVVENNLIVDSFRGIALGLTPPASGYDHVGGVIRNNVVVNLNDWADEAIEANAAKGVRIEHNTVLVTGGVPWSIGVRFPTATAVVRNNLTNRPLRRRDHGNADEAGGIDRATADWFVDAARGDLRLAPGRRAAVGAGVATSEVTLDFAGRPRPSGSPTVGAFEPDAAGSAVVTSSPRVQ